MNNPISDNQPCDSQPCDSQPCDNLPCDSQSLQQEAQQAKEAPRWYAMRVFMNKVSVCRDLFNIYNNVLLGLNEPDKNFPDEMRGEVMQYYAPFHKDVFVNSRGKRVTIEKPIIPSLFFMRSSLKQAECLEENLQGRARLYRKMREFNQEPISIPLKQMQMFMMVSSGDQEGLDYFEDGAFSWQKGERVRVIDGRFKGLVGEIKRINGDHRLVVAVEGICCVATSYIPRCFLEKLD